MPRDNEIGSVRFEKITEVVMTRVEAYSNSNDVNGGRNERDVVTVLARRVDRLSEREVPATIGTVLK